MHNRLNRVKGVQYLLCIVQIFTRIVQIIKTELYTCHSNRSKDESVLRLLIVDFLGDRQ